MISPATESGDLALDRDISSTVEEFVRGLRRAFPDLRENHPFSFTAASAGISLDIEFRSGPPRRIALLVLPTLLVSLRFAGGDRAGQTAMLEHLDRYLHRGGG